ncbi:hypothetical protein OIU83_22635 [Flavobacterium sp. LS1R49]|uniref:DUF8188 domain-containing protein n=1 Tax=Flavobacterium shii TaxID=2987687 RepID=A0A9X3BZM5_9FLAO|nr:hypothetical protein [Flavobacterium shii]MCV9930475.1 hypothetical protein [Flavobacterium shii]
MKNLGIPYAIGYILAGIIGLPLLLYAVNLLFFQTNDGEKYMQQYIQNSEEIKLFMPELKPRDPSSLVIEPYGWEQHTIFLSRKGGKINIDFITFFSEEYKKYFSIRLAQEVFFGYFRMKLFNRPIIITVNKDDMANPLYGTKENPIPVFKVVGDGKPITINTSDKNGNIIYLNYDVTQQMYEDNVFYHLTYIMPKEEFVARFEK